MEIFHLSWTGFTYAWYLGYLNKHGGIECIRFGPFTSREKAVQFKEEQSINRVRGAR